MAPQPDGMGEDMYRERQNMREASWQFPEMPFDIVAIGHDGEVMYVTESERTLSDAEEQCDSCNEYHESHPNDLPEVSHFEVVER